jgi:threonylcarbamoyladenosine tRNA methylthiotransferase MtaB
MRVNLQVLGCRLNEAELQQWAGDFRAHGYEITNQVDDADLLVVNTCAVTGEAGRKSRQLVRRAQRNNPRAKLVVSGCYATLEQEQAAAIEGVDLVVPNQDKDQLVERIHQELDLPVMPALAQRPAENALFQRGRSRAFIKVQDGCRWRCTYCIVTVARGEERSTPVDKIVAQINDQAERGVKEVVLTGVHLGGYGSDLDTDLYSLVKTVLEETDIPRIRFGSLEPWDLHEGFFALFDNVRLMPHLHLPLQSGADSVLKRMARRCKTGDFRLLVESAREAIPGLNVTTDIIVGFPGESDDEWRQGYEFIQSTGFGHTHIFAYSPREGTKAARMPDAVNPQEIKQRSAQLHDLAELMKQEFERRQQGKNLDVLLEEKVEKLESGRYRYAGYTSNFIRVDIESDQEGLNNSIVEYRLPG